MTCLIEGTDRTSESSSSGTKSWNVLEKQKQLRFNRQATKRHCINSKAGKGLISLDIK